MIARIVLGSISPYCTASASLRCFPSFATSRYRHRLQYTQISGILGEVLIYGARRRRGEHTRWHGKKGAGVLLGTGRGKTRKDPAIAVYIRHRWGPITRTWERSAVPFIFFTATLPKCIGNKGLHTLTAYTYHLSSSYVSSFPLRCRSRCMFFSHANIFCPCTFFI